MSDQEFFYEDTDDDEFLLEALELAEEEEEGGEGTSKRRKGRGKKEVRVPLATCMLCDPNRPFYSFDGYKGHMKAHNFQELYKTGPGQAGLEAECLRVHKDVLLTIRSKIEKYVTGIAKEVVPFVNELVNREDVDAQDFVKAVVDCLWKCVPLPTAVKLSTFHHTFLKSLNEALNQPAVTAGLVSCLQRLQVLQISSAALQWFTTHYIRKMGMEVEAFYLRSMREPRELIVYTSVGQTREIERDSITDTDVQQSVYYVGGSVVRSVLSLAMRSVNNSQWNAIDNFIRTRVLVGDLVSAPPGSVVEWTQSQDRGGLKFIGEPMYTFLMGLTSILRVSEKKDGSILHDEIQEVVKSDPAVMFLWCEVVGDFLSEEDSDFLLFHICRNFVNTWGRGVALRHRNKIVNRVKDKTALRAGLASKGK